MKNIKKQQQSNQISQHRQVLSNKLNKSSKCVKNYKKFVYNPGIKYIRLVQFEHSQNNYLIQNNNIQHCVYLYPDSIVFPNLSQPPLLLYNLENVKKCYLLDHQCFLMATDAQLIRDLKRQFYGEKYPNFIEKHNSFRKYIENQTQIFGVISFEYLTSSLVTDLVFGRSEWVREFNSVSISSDVISRNHCKLKYNHKQKPSLEQLVFRFCIKKSRKRSLLGQIPQELIRIIFSYIDHQPTYTLIDNQSRNGTYIQELPYFINHQWVNKPVQLAPLFSYQFQDEDYFIKIHKIYMPNNLQPHQHNIEARNIVEQYKKNSKKISYSSKYIQDKMHIPHQLYNNKCDQKTSNQKCTCKKISVIIFSIKYNDDLQQYYLIGTIDNMLLSQQKFKIRQKTNQGFFQSSNYYHNTNFGNQYLDQDNNFSINISNMRQQSQQNYKIHGYMIYSNKKWYICNSQDQLFILNQNFKLTHQKLIGDIRPKVQLTNDQIIHYYPCQLGQKIWTKINQEQIVLDVKKRYRIRLGHHMNHFLLQFIDYQSQSIN